MTDEIKSISPSVKQMIMQSIADFINASGVNNLFSLLKCIDLMREHLKINYGEEFLEKKISEELKNFSEFKDYKEMNSFIEQARPRINAIQMHYDRLKTAKTRTMKEREELRNQEIQLSVKMSPYQKELYFLFMVLLKVSGIQGMVIPKEILRNPEASKHATFDKKTKEGVLKE